MRRRPLIASRPASAAAAKYGKGALVMAGARLCHAIELLVARGNRALQEP